MEWNILLLWLAGPSCLIMLFNALRARPVLTGWILVSLAILAIGFLAWWKLPQSAGYIAGALWAVFMFAPGRIQRSVQSLSSQRQFDRASRLARLVALLHPFDGYWQMPEFYRALGLADRGETAAAMAILRRLESAPARVAQPAKLYLSRLTNQSGGIPHHPDRQQDQERHFAPMFQLERRPWVTWILIAINLVMFGLEWHLGGTTNDWALYRLGALVPGTWQTHQYYRLLTANFLHYGTAHITMNMLGLLVIGPFVEFNLGWFWYLLLYLLTGVLTMLSIVFFWRMHWMHPEFLIGASGAIMALVGATAAILVRSWYRERGTSVHRRLWIIVGIVALQATFDHFTPQVSGAAHMVGVAWGFLFASIMPHGPRVRPPRGFEVVPVERR